MRLTRLLMLGTLVALVLPRAASAQAPIVNPTTAIIGASTDQGKTLPDGTKAVIDYSLALTLAGATSPVTTLSVVQQSGGTLPTPDASNNITLVIPNAFKALGFGAYTAASAAVGPGGTSAFTAASNPFESIPAPAAPGKTTVK